MTYVIIYENQNNETHVTELDFEPDEINKLCNDEQYKYDLLSPLLNGYKSLIYLFDAKSDILQHKNNVRAKFLRNAHKHDIPYDWFYRTFKARGEVFRFIGIESRNTKYKCLIQNIESGKISKATTGFVKKYLSETA